MSLARHLRFSLFTAVFLGAAWSVSAQQIPLSVPFGIEGVAYDKAIPSPDSVLGYRIGERHTRPHELVEYFRAVAAASDRVRVVTYGQSFEGRPLIAAVVTSRANQKRIDRIRESNMRLSEEPGDVSDADLEDMPVVAELHYAVHGNEASGSEAALLMLYHFAAGEGEPVESVLEHAVVLIDPCINPDGRDRFVDWVNENRSPGGNPDPQDREHNEPWPGGRTNHYWFDLNRDWLPAQLPESRGRLELFHVWRPQVVLDGHEMGSDETFFFQPGVPERANPNTPKKNQELTEKLSRYTARALDRIGSLYFTKEQYDDFYYGKGSTYPDVNGSVGILFEQGSSRALRTATTDGQLSYGFTVRNQLAASLGLLEGVVRMRTELLGNQRAFYATAIEESRSQPVRAWIFGSEEDRTRSDALVETLLRHRVHVYALTRPTTVDGRRFEPGSAYVIPTAQRQFRLVKAAFERVHSFQDSVFYDVSTWTLPLAFGVAYGAITDDVSSLLSERVREDMASGGHLIGGKSDYGYVMGWDRYYAPRALYRMLAAGVPARVVLRPFELMVGGRRVRFERGTIVLPAHDRSEEGGISVDSLHDLITEAVLHDHVVIHSIGRSLTTEGPDLGGPSTVRLHLPAAAALSGRGVSAYRLGELRYLFNERMGIPVSLLDVDRLDEVSLDRYSALVMVDGDYGSLSPEFVDRLKAWISGGGRLLVAQRAARWSADRGLATVEFQSFEEPAESRWVRFEERDVARRSSDISGAILEVQLDSSHPIAFGLRQRIASFKLNREVLKPVLDAGATVGVYTHDPVLSGYVPSDRKSAFGGTAAVLSVTSGEGRIVLMEDSATFRGFWLGTNRLLLNAVLFGEAY